MGNSMRFPLIVPWLGKERAESSVLSYFDWTLLLPSVRIRGNYFHQIHRMIDNYLKVVNTNLNYYTLFFISQILPLLPQPTESLLLIITPLKLVLEVRLLALSHKFVLFLCLTSMALTSKACRVVPATTFGNSIKAFVGSRAYMMFDIMKSIYILESKVETFWHNVSLPKMFYIVKPFSFWYKKLKAVV